MNPSNSQTPQRKPSALFRVHVSQTLDMGCCWNDSLEVVALPGRLLALILGDKFDQPLERVDFPPGLKTLTVGNAFRQPLVGVRFPPGLAMIKLGDSFSGVLDDVKWPPALKRVFFGCSMEIDTVLDADWANVPLDDLVVGNQVLVNGGHWLK